MGVFAMVLRLAGFRLLIAELRGAINNRKSSINDDHNRDCLSIGNVEEPLFWQEDLLRGRGAREWAMAFLNGGARSLSESSPSPPWVWLSE